MLLPIKVPYYSAVSYHLLMKSSWSDSSFFNCHPVPLSGSQHTVSWAFIYYPFYELSFPGFTSDMIFISSLSDILLHSQPMASENPLWMINYSFCAILTVEEYPHDQAFLSKFASLLWDTSTQMFVMKRYLMLIILPFLNSLSRVIFKFP